MKLISLNVEGSKHLDKTEAFINALKPDVICLQECDENTLSFLQKLNYTTHFLPVALRDYGTKILKEGVALASKLPMTTEGFVYFEPSAELNIFKSAFARETSKQGFVFGTIMLGTTPYHIASNHFTWTPDGNVPSQPQIEDMESFLAMTKDLPAHVMCGDFNIPRQHNYLYNNLTELYADNIPQTYKSSMDKSLHKLGSDTSKEILFTDYMVDYVFSKPPYLVTDVRFQFGVSDHAAVLATITL